MQLAPSILSGNFCNLRDNLAALEQEQVGLLHLDVMDGHFVPNLTFGPPVIRDISGSFHGKIEAHLMIEQPEKSVESYVKSGCHRVMVQAEVCTHLHRVCQQIRSLGAEVGVVLNPHTPLSVVRHVWNEIDLLLLMTVNPGFGGQQYIEAVDEKIQQAVEWKRTRKNLLLEVDGGIKIGNIRRMKDMGVDLCVVGSAIFNKDSEPVKNIRALRAAYE